MKQLSKSSTQIKTDQRLKKNTFYVDKIKQCAHFQHINMLPLAKRQTVFLHASSHLCFPFIVTSGLQFCVHLIFLYHAIILLKSWFSSIFNSDIELSVEFCSCFISVCLSVALLKATYAVNLHIALSCQH